MFNSACCVDDILQCCTVALASLLNCAKLFSFEHFSNPNFLKCYYMARDRINLRLHIQQGQPVQLWHTPRYVLCLHAPRWAES